METNADIRVLADAGKVSRTAAAIFVDSAVAAIQDRGCFHVCLAGGTTPQEAYALLANSPKRAIDWTKVQVYFGDERCVPPNHADSNYLMAANALLRHVNVETAHVHRIAGELGSSAAADDYERIVRARLTHSGNRFDLVFLGLGDDGHTASLFPNTAALHVRDRWCVANAAPVQPADRVTLTYPAFNSARRVVFLVTGVGKSQALQSAITSPTDLKQRPAQGVRPVRGELVWLVDPEAASALPAAIRAPHH